MRLTMLAAAAIGLSGLIAVPATADDFRPIPNNLKYKESGVPNARGRSGSASIEARALLNRNLSTDVEVVAGTFDPATTNGTIERVLVRPADGAAVNFAGTGSAAGGGTMTGLARGEGVQIQANVGGVDGARNDVVSVSGVVKLRPDLKVAAMDVQPTGVIDLPVKVRAIVQEMNGDTGARANCVLFADGTAVDHAGGIWVDAGDSVTCEFAPSFATAGRKALKVVVDAVSPGDYDPGNNSAEGSTLIYDPADAFTDWVAFARDDNWSRVTRNTYTSPAGSQTTNNLVEGWTTDTNFYTQQREVLDVPALRLSYRLTSDGRTLQEIVDAPFTPVGSRNPFSRPCGRIIAGSARADVCVRQFPPEFHLPAYTQLNVSTNGGTVTYHTEMWEQWYDENGESQTQYYTWNDHASFGMQGRFGSTVAMDVSVTDGARTLWAQPYMTMAPYDSHTEQSSCDSGWCSTDEESHHGVVGNSNAGSDPAGLYWR